MFEPIESRIDAVTVYRDGALVTRVADLPHSKSGFPSQVRVTGLPLSLDDRSVIARIAGDDASGDLPVAIRLRIGLDDASTTDAEPGSDALLAARRVEARARAQLSQRRKEQDRISHLTTLPRSATDASSDGASTQARLRLVEFRAERAQQLANEVRSLQVRLQAAEDRRRELESAADPGELVKAALVTLDGTDAKAKSARLVIQYAVPGCRWAPAYSLHLGRSLTDARLSVRALVRQHTGEHWDAIGLTLCTADLLCGTEFYENVSRSPAWRPPPTGAVRLYGDHDLAFGEPSLNTSAVEPSSGPNRVVTVSDGLPGNDEESYRCALTIDDGSGRPELMEFDQPMINIGRARRNDIVLSESSVSKNHARLLASGGQLTVIDLDSLRGTFVNGERIQTPRTVQPGDVVSVTNLFTLTIQDPRTVRADDTPMRAEAATHPIIEAVDDEPNAVTDMSIDELPFDDSHFEEEEDMAPPKWAVAFTEAGGSAERVALEAWEVRIGRARANDIVLARPDVSKHHARIFIEDDMCVIEDLGSSGGVMVNGERILDPTRIGPSDAVFISRFALRVEPPVPRQLALPSGGETPTMEFARPVLPTDAEAPTRKLVVVAPIIGADSRLLSYDRLRMPDAGSPERGHLTRLERPDVYRELLGSSMPADALRSVTAAFEQAKGVDKQLEGGLRLVTQDDHFDYSYNADSRVEILSDGRGHSIPLVARSTQSKANYVTVPSESTDVFRQVELTNPLEVPLLEGPLDVYVDGEHLLTTRLETKAADAQFRLDLGIERAIAVTRTTDKDDVTESGEGGRVNLNHRIHVEVTNELEQPSTIEVRERIPVSAAGDSDTNVVIGQVEPDWRPYETDGAAIEGAYRWTLSVGAGETEKLTAGYAVQMPDGHAMSDGGDQ